MLISMDVRLKVNFPFMWVLMVGEHSVTCKFHNYSALVFLGSVRFGFSVFMVMSTILIT
jgi:hypothetical protein